MLSRSRTRARSSHVPLEVFAHEVGQARAVEAVLHGGVEGAQVLAHETVKGLPSMGEIVELPEVGGLHHRYERRAA
jgi:hypothetical protein